MRADGGGADVGAPVDVTRQLAGSGPEAPKHPALAVASPCVIATAEVSPLSPRLRRRPVGARRCRWRPPPGRSR